MLHTQSRAPLQSKPYGVSKRLCHRPATLSDTGLSRLPATDLLGVESLQQPVPAPCNCHGYPQQVVPRVARSILGAARRLRGQPRRPHHMCWTTQHSSNVFVCRAKLNACGNLTDYTRLIICWDQPLPHITTQATLHSITSYITSD